MSDKWFLCQLVDRENIVPAREWIQQNLKEEKWRHSYVLTADNKVVFSRNFVIMEHEDVLAFCLKFRCA